LKMCAFGTEYAFGVNNRKSYHGRPQIWRWIAADKSATQPT
jgi:hypothetical protein